MDKSEEAYIDCTVATCGWPEEGCAYRKWTSYGHPWLERCQARIFVDVTMNEDPTWGLGDGGGPPMWNSRPL